MSKKFNPEDPEVAKIIVLFQSIGFSKAKATETAKSQKIAQALSGIIESNSLADKNLDEKKASLISGLAGQSAKLNEDQKSYIVNAILDGRLKLSEQVNGKGFHSFMYAPLMYFQPLSNS